MAFSKAVKEPKTKSLFRPQLLSYLLIVIAVATLLTGCKVYSFNGANVPPEIKNFSVELFQNRANNGPASLSQIFTDRLKLKFQTEGNLRQVPSEGDLQFKGAIVGYTYTNDAPVAGATSGLNKLTITVQVDYTNIKNEKDKWSESFSRYAQFSSSENIASVEDRLISEINTQLVDDIFQKALVKW